MTDGLSRRDLVALGGAGLALSAFDWKEGGGSAVAAADDPPLYPMAPCEPHGLHPSSPPNGTTHSQDFVAQYICVIHLNFSEPWRMSVNYASFRMKGFTDLARLKKAKNVLIERFDPKVPVTRFSQLSINRPYKGIDWIDFNKFGFGTKHELFFFFESPNVSLDKDWLIVLPRLSLKHPGTDNDPNYSFLYARIVSEIDMGSYLYSKGRMFRVRDYVQDKHGNPITTSEDYSMNIHFKIACGINEWVPMVIDPETGNGAGNEP
jgi:hypothetical protein